MQCDELFNVVGIRENGDRVIITESTRRGVAERVRSAMSGSSIFVEFVIEPVGGEPLTLEPAHAG